VKHLIIKNVSSNYLLNLFSMLLGFLIVPFLIGRLGRDAFGLIVLAEAALVFFEIMTASVRISLSRYGTVSLSQNKADDFVAYLSTGRTILFVSAAAVFTAGSLISWHFTHLFNVPAVFHDSSRILFFFITIAATISIPNIVFWSALYAKQRFDLINASSSVGLMIRAVCLFGYYSIMPREQASLAAYGVIYLVMTLAQNGMIYYFHRRLMPGVHFHLRFFQWNKIRQILSFSGHTAIFRASLALYQDAAMILINIFWGPAMNAVFSIGTKLPITFMRIFVEPSWALGPTFTDLAARGERERFESLFFMYSKVLAIVTLPMCFTLLFFSRPIIVLWVGPDFSAASGIMSISMIQVILSIPFSMTWAVFLAYGKVRIPSLVSLGMGVINVLLCLALGVVMDLQLRGIITAFVVTGTVCGVLVFPVYACRLTGFSLKRYWTGCFVKPFLLCCLTVGAAIGLLKEMTGELKIDAASVLTTAGAAAGFYLLSYLFLLGGEGKNYVRGLIRSKLPVRNAPHIPGSAAGGNGGTLRPFASGTGSAGAPAEGKGTGVDIEARSA
jgi:O-antigen/teichoic acid export membrane protein